MVGLFLFIAGIIFFISPAILFIMQNKIDDDTIDADFYSWLTKTPLQHIQKLSLMQHFGLLLIFMSLVYPAI